ncbi:hypothetical protein ACO1O0_005788 [Amphichorda felina]
MRAGTAGDMAQQGTSRREYLNIALSQDQDLASDLLITPVDHTYTVDDQDDDVNRLPSSRDLFCRDRRWVAQYPDGGEEGEDEDEDPGSDGKEDGDGYELINRKRVDTVTQRGDYSSHSGRTTYDGSRGGRPNEIFQCPVRGQARRHHLQPAEVRSRGYPRRGDFSRDELWCPPCPAST